jgi:hypothetical protein
VRQYKDLRRVRHVGRARGARWDSLIYQTGVQTHNLNEVAEETVGLSTIKAQVRKMEEEWQEKETEHSRNFA